MSGRTDNKDGSETGLEGATTYTKHDESHLLTEEEVKEASETFDFLDLNKDGLITIDAALTAIKIMNINIDEPDLRGIGEQMEKMGKKKFGKTTFFQLLGILKTTLMRAEEVTEEDLFGAFSAFARHHNAGHVIFLKDMQSVLKTLEMNVSRDDLREMMEEADFDRAGWIDFQKFKIMMLDAGIFPGRTFKK